MVKRKYISTLILTAAALALAGCASKQEQGTGYASPYQNWRTLCFVPAQAHSSSLDMLALRALRDRGFDPVLIENQDEASIGRCRNVVTFSTNAGIGPFETPDAMSLTFNDRYTGETYHVATAKKAPLEKRSIFVRGAESDPAVTIRQLVERLFPESPVEKP